jgi:hypothetical protein
MWLLSFLPSGFLLFIINTVLICGAIGAVLGFLGSRLPFIGNYANVIKYVSIALLCIGIYWKGGYSVEQEWRQRVAELEEKIKDAEAKSQQTNVVIETKIRERTKRVVEKREIVVQKIKEVEKVIDAKCELDSNVVSILNEAAKKP